MELVDSDEGSLLDEYDKENGYIEEESKQRFSKRDLIFWLYRGMHENGISYSECQATDFCSYVDFICYMIDNPKEESEVV